MPNTGLITYTGLPLGRGGAHSLRSKSAASAWASIRKFLDNCTSVIEPISPLCYIRQPAGQAALEPIISRLSTEFGQPVAGQTKHRTDLNWFLTETQLIDAIEYLDAMQSVPADEYGRSLVYFQISTSFQLIAPDGSGVLPGQDPGDYLHIEGEPDFLLGRSYIRANLGPKSTFFSFLSFPFDEPDSAFHEYAEFVSSYFPCRMSSKTWKHWRITKKGTNFTGRKLTMS